MDIFCNKSHAFQACGVIVHSGEVPGTDAGGIFNPTFFQSDDQREVDRGNTSVAAQFPEIQYKELIVDNACMQIVMDPRQFDVLLLPNLYGDVMSDLAAGLVGGLGLVPSANIGEECAIFEAVHGTAPDIAGKGLANPTALLMSGILMLEHLGERTAAERIDAALKKVYLDGKYTTRDVGGTAGTAEFADAVIAEIDAKAFSA